MALPKPGDPLVLPNGVVVFDDETKEARRTTVVEYQERRVIPRFTAFAPAQPLDPAMLPEADEKRQAALAAIVGMRMMGLDFADIAVILGVTNDILLDLVNSPATQATFERIFRGLIHVNADSIQGRVGAYAQNAMDVMLELMNDPATRDDVRFKSAQDVLDRSGTNPDHFFGASKDGFARDDELRIVMMDEEGKNAKIDISVTRKR